MNARTLVLFSLVVSATLLAGQTSLPPAHTVESDEYVAKAGASPWRSAHYTFAFRGDGSTAIVTSTFDSKGAPVAIDRKVTLSTGVYAEIADHLKAVTATRSPNAAAVMSSRTAGGWDPGSNCAVTFDKLNRRAAPEKGEAIAGHATVKFVEDSASMRLTRWFAPGLGCSELKQLAEFKGAGGAITDTSQRTAVKVTRGEPDEALFDWPNEYEYLSPSERYLKSAASCGCPVSPETLAALKRSDPSYRERAWRKP
ncbi:MAG: hypothetical protein SFV54_26200 [Bryobacteraceae bacterium]|nr:hypothetical protein [Bryobacteraceae bacterium]